MLNNLFTRIFTKTKFDYLNKSLLIGLSVNFVIAASGYVFLDYKTKNVSTEYSESISLTDLNYLESQSYESISSLGLVQKVLKTNDVENESLSSSLQKLEVVDDSLVDNYEISREKYDSYVRELAGVTQTLYKELYNSHPLVSESMNSVFAQMKKFTSFQSLEARYDAFSEFKSNLTSLILKYEHHPLKDKAKHKKIKLMLSSLHDNALASMDLLNAKVKRIKISNEVKNKFSPINARLRSLYDSSRTNSSLAGYYLILSTLIFGFFLLYNLFSKTMRIENVLEQRASEREDIVENITLACEQFTIDQNVDPYLLASVPDEVSQALSLASQNLLIAKLVEVKSPNPMLIVNGAEEVIWKNSEFSKISISKYVKDENSWNEILDQVIVNAGGEHSLSKHIKFRSELQKDFILESSIQSIAGQDFRLITFLPLHEAMQASIKNEITGNNADVFDLTEIVQETADEVTAQYGINGNERIKINVNTNSPLLVTRVGQLEEEGVQNTLSEILKGLTIYTRSIKNRGQIQINHYLNDDRISFDFLVKGINFDQDRILSPMIINGHQYPSLETFLNSSERFVETLGPQITIKNRIAKDNYQVMAIVKLSINLNSLSKMSNKRPLVKRTGAQA